MAKKRKPPRKSRPTKRKKRAPKGAPVSPFARAKIARPFARQRSADVQAAAYQKWARAKGAIDQSVESRRRQVRKLLERRNVYPEVIEKIAAIDPDKWYMIDIYGYAPSPTGDPSESAGMPGDEPILQASFTGNGAELWSRCVSYAAKAPIEHVEIVELDQSTVRRPLWGRDSVKTIDGRRVYGHGNLDEWKDRKKQGAPKKSGGGMNAAERRKRDKSKNEAIKRKQKMKARYEKLKKTDPVAADRMLRRAERARKIDL